MFYGTQCVVKITVPLPNHCFLASIIVNVTMYVLYFQLFVLLMSQCNPYSLILFVVTSTTQVAANTAQTL